MSTPTVQNAKTQFVTTHDGIKLAYRVIGPPLSTSSHPPLLFLHHFRGTIDSWDPLLVHTFTAQGRPVILFDNAGIGHSSGTVDDSIPAMAAHIIEFLSLLSIKEVDILGFSLGGVIAPLVYLNGPKGHVRKLVLAGTQPTAGPDMLPAMADPLVVSVAGASELPVETFLTLFFKKTPTSEAAGRAWWSRSHERSLSSSGEERIGYVSEGYLDRGAGIQALVAAIGRGADPAFSDEGSYNRLGEIDIPVLIANGNEDAMVPTVNSWTMSQKIKGAYLMIYPDAGHGFLFQHAEAFAKLAGDFLDGW